MQFRKEKNSRSIEFNNRIVDPTLFDTVILYRHVIIIYHELNYSMNVYLYIVIFVIVSSVYFVYCNGKFNHVTVINGIINAIALLLYILYHD